MIVPEWKRVLDGLEPFEDPDAEVLAKEIMRRMELSTNASEIIELANDLEEVMGHIEWLTRKNSKLQKDLKIKKHLLPEEIDFITKKSGKILNKRNEVVNKIKSKYGIV